MSRTRTREHRAEQRRAKPNLKQQRRRALQDGAGERGHVARSVNGHRGAP